MTNYLDEKQKKSSRKALMVFFFNLPFLYKTEMNISAKGN